MRILVFIFLLLIAFSGTNAQSKMIKEVFRLLPADKIYDLTIGTRDSMLQGKTYYPADNDSISIEAYNYGISVHVNDYMYVSMSFETAQRASGMIEMRSFKKTNGENLVIVSKTGGVLNVTYSQHELSAFIYDRNKGLAAYEGKVFPAIDESLFMKKGIPDSVKKMVMNNSNMCFDFSNEKPTLGLNSDYVTDNTIARKWLKGDRIYFDWIKDRFVISKIEFEFPGMEK